MTELSEARIEVEQAKAKAEEDRSDMYDNWGCAGHAAAIFLIVLSLGSCSLMDKYGDKLDAETKILKQQLKDTK